MRGADILLASENEFPYNTVMKVLFVCTQGQIRSATAAFLYSRTKDIEVRCAGTERNLRADDIVWADIVFAMEDRHVQIMNKRWPTQCDDKQIVCLDIPDDYDYLGDDLMDLLQYKINTHIGQPDTPPKDDIERLKKEYDKSFGF